eukprot:CAMPEP_0195078436 /NCGR_PEP_ID=MMETSP0448-20130528/20626_1 /TAXON_ID=66468 /ORGANISM="Heterocapsa triquestra, Strain CCMP 448" /LENGTH=50 /DNA_ID=CAMNT_0040111177 /DNA_START=89 /DNA_END=238 /DNA_ORIENTATION=-
MKATVRSLVLRALLSGRLHCHLERSDLSVHLRDVTTSPTELARVAGCAVR